MCLLHLCTSFIFLTSYSLHCPPFSITLFPLIFCLPLLSCTVVPYHMHPAIGQLQTNITTVAPLPIFSDTEDISLVVCDAIGYSVLFRYISIYLCAHLSVCISVCVVLNLAHCARCRDIHKKGLTSPVLLPDSDKFDTITCIQGRVLFKIIFSFPSDPPSYLFVPPSPALPNTSLYFQWRMWTMMV